MSIGLNYLPTAEKLYLTIVKVRGLRPMNKQDNTTGKLRQGLIDCLTSVELTISQMKRGTNNG